MSDLGCTLGVSDKSTTKEIEMNSSVVFLPTVGIRSGSTLEGRQYWPTDTEVWNYVGPCQICSSWGIYGDGGDYCLDCN